MSDMTKVWRGLSIVELSSWRTSWWLVVILENFVSISCCWRELPVSVSLDLWGSICLHNIPWQQQSQWWNLATKLQGMDKQLFFCWWQAHQWKFNWYSCLQADNQRSQWPSSSASNWALQTSPWSSSLAQHWPSHDNIARFLQEGELNKLWTWLSRS